LRLSTYFASSGGSETESNLSLHFSCWIMSPVHYWLDSLALDAISRCTSNHHFLSTGSISRCQSNHHFSPAGYLRTPDNQTEPIMLSDGEMLFRNRMHCLIGVNLGIVACGRFPGGQGRHATTFAPGHRFIPRRPYLPLLRVELVTASGIESASRALEGSLSSIPNEGGWELEPLP